MPTMLETVRSQVNASKVKLAEMEDMMQRLRLAGEDTAALELKAGATREKIERYDLAFAE